MESKDTFQVELNNGTHQFNFDNERISELDITKIDSKNYHLLVNNKAYRAELLEADFSRKTLRLKVNGKSFELQIADKYDRLVEKMGLNSQASRQIKDIKAPMPGMVLTVSVAVGQNVQQGDGLIILEAMKMENVIKAQGEGVIKEIHVTNGTAVDKGQLLVEME